MRIEAAGLCHSDLPVESLISSHIRLDDINEGMDTLADGNAVRQIILFD